MDREEAAKELMAMLEEAQEGGYLNPLSLSTMRIMAGLFLFYLH